MPFASQFASFLVFFVEDAFSHGVRRAVVPGFILLVCVQAASDDDARAHIRATPSFAATVKSKTDPEIFVFHQTC
jgi:hypothetical protein